MSLPYRLLARWFSPPGDAARLTILIYHRVLPQHDPLIPPETTCAEFEAQMGEVSRCFNVLPLSEAVARLKVRSLPARAACITFDDGYADNLIHAAPILKRHGLTATFFIATAYLDGGRMFNDTVIEAVRRADAPRVDLTDLGLGVHDLSGQEGKAAAIADLLPRVKYLPAGRREAMAEELAARLASTPLPDDLMMTSAQLRQLHGLGMEIGGHTHRHPILAALDDVAVRAEVMEGRERLEALLGERPRVFAYPNGRPGQDYLPEQSRLVRELGFEGAVSTQPGSAWSGSDPWQLPRYIPWNHKRYMPLVLNNLRNPA